MGSGPITRRAALALSSAALAISSSPAMGQSATSERANARRRLVVYAFHRWLTQRGSRAELGALLSELPTFIDFTLAANFQQDLFGHDAVVEALTSSRDAGMLGIDALPSDEQTLVYGDLVVFTGLRPYNPDTATLYSFDRPVAFNFLIQPDNDGELRILALSVVEPFTPPFCGAIAPEEMCHEGRVPPQRRRNML